MPKEKNVSDQISRGEMCDHEMICRCSDVVGFRVGCEEGGFDRALERCTVEVRREMKRTGNMASASSCGFQSAE